MIFMGYDLVALRIALSVTADEKEPSNRLNGLYFDFPHKRLIASDGHRLFMCELPACNVRRNPRLFIVRHPVTGKQVHSLPANWSTVLIDADTKSITDRKSKASSLVLDEVSDTYPDVDGPVKMAVGNYSANLGPAQTQVDSRLLKVGVEGRMAMTNVSKGVVVTFPNLHVNHFLLVMGVNIDGPVDQKETIENLLVNDDEEASL